MRFIIRTDEPFKGVSQSILLDDWTVAYTGGLSWDAYKANHGGNVRIVSAEQLDAMTDAYNATLITDPEPITEAQFWDALEVLPPCRWGKVRGVELFHVSERITGDLVNWYACLNGRHWHFVDRDRQTRERLAEKVAVAAGLVAS